MTKSRTLRKAGAVVLSLAMAFSLTTTATVDAAAKKPVLSAKKATLAGGKTKTVTVKNAKKKDLTWKKSTVTSNKKAVATVKKLSVKKNANMKFKVTAKKNLKKKQTATITVKVTYKKKRAGKKVWKLKFKATVKKGATTPTAAPEPTTEPTAAPTTAPTTEPTTAPTTAPAVTGVAVTGVTLSNTTPKVGDTINAEYAPADASNVTYVWELVTDSAAVTGTAVGTEASLKVDASMVGSYIRVTVKGDDNSSATATTNAAVAKEVVAATLIDEDGLQSDGTALLADTLRVTYTAELGNPTQVTWYRDGTAITSSGLAGGALGFTNNAGVAGTYYAVITNTEGKTFQSNSIVKTDIEKVVKISDFTLENYEAYSEGNGGGTAKVPALKSKTDTIIATATLNKEVNGDFYLYKDGDKVTKAIVPVHDSADLAADFDTVTVKSQLSNLKLMETANATTTGKGLKFKNDDGSWTYKFIVDEDATWDSDELLTRGTKYVLGFDQDNLTSDDVTATGVKSGAKENVAPAVVAPYLNAPASIKVKSFAQGGTTADIAFLDKDGNELAWMNAAAALNTPVTGFDKINLFNIDNATATAKDTALTYTNNTLVKGVATITVGALANKYAYAEYTPTAGIFAATSTALKSAVAETAADPADALTVSQNADKATSADINFTNLSTKAAGTVYVLKAQGIGEEGKDFVNVSNLKTAYVVGEAKISGGEKKVTIANVFDKACMGSATVTTDGNGDPGDMYDDPYGYASTATDSQTAFGTAADADKSAACYLKGQYGAIFVPNDPTSFATMISDNDGTDAFDCTPFFLTESVKSWKLSGTVEFTSAGGTASDGKVESGAIATTLQGVNQFGDNVTANLATELTGGTVKFSAGAATTTDISVGSALPTLTITAAGAISIDGIKPATAIKTSDKWTLTTTYGTFTLGVKTAGTTAADTAAAVGTEVFTLTYAK